MGQPKLALRRLEPYDAKASSTVLRRAATSNGRRLSDNILINDKTQNITFIDLGEIVISHPFFSLIGCLRQTKKHYAVTEQDDFYRQLMDACLKNFITFESSNHLLETFSLAQLLWIIYEALSQYRLRIACDEARFLSFQRHGRLSGALRELMTNLSQNQ